MGNEFDEISNIEMFQLQGGDLPSNSNGGRVMSADSYA
jgi:hypothetical protein